MATMAQKRPIASGDGALKTHTVVDIRNSGQYECHRFDSKKNGATAQS